MRQTAALPTDRPMASHFKRREARLRVLEATRRGANSGSRGAAGDEHRELALDVEVVSVASARPSAIFPSITLLQTRNNQP